MPTNFNDMSLTNATRTSLSTSFFMTLDGLNRLIWRVIEVYGVGEAPIGGKQ